jgi:hypothetical protein
MAAIGTLRNLAAPEKSVAFGAYGHGWACCRLDPVVIDPSRTTRHFGLAQK